MQNVKTMASPRTVVAAKLSSKARVKGINIGFDDKGEAVVRVSLGYLDDKDAQIATDEKTLDLKDDALKDLKAVIKAIVDAV